MLGSGVTLTNSAALAGGSAGTGGLTTYNGSAVASTTYGKGGAAIAGANLTINDSANLTGGLNGDGTRGAAIDFTGGVNTLNITGGAIIGGIIDTGSLALESSSPFFSSTYSGISGTGSLDIALGNNVQLTGTNTYSGGTTVEGELTLGNSTIAGTITGAVTISGSLAVDLPSGSSVTLGAVSGPGFFSVDAGTAIVPSDDDTGSNNAAGTSISLSATLTLTGNATGAISNNGTLNLAPTGAATVSGAIANGGTLNLAPTSPAPLTISGAISDYLDGQNSRSGTVVAQSGTTILSGANTYSGATYLEGGVIDAENAAAFGTGTVIAVDPEIDYGPASGSTANSATQTNAIILDVGSPAASDPTILNVASGFTETISGNITTGSGTNSAGQTIDPNQPLVVDGAGKLLLQGANSFSGGTTLGGSGTLDLDSASAAGASGGTGTNGAVNFATGSTATLRIDEAATSGPNYDFTYADPISNFAYGENIDLANFLYEPQATTSVMLSGTTLTVNAASDGTATATLTNFADASGQSGVFATASDGYGGTLVTLTPPPVAPTIGGVVSATQATTSEATLQPFSTVMVADTNNGGANSDTLTITQTGTGTLSGTGLAPGAGGTYTLTGTAAAITTSLDALVFTPVDGVPNTAVTTSFTLRAADATAGTSSATSAAVTVSDSDPAVAPTITRSPQSYGLTTLATFTGSANGANPYASLLVDSAGNLYGTTENGGASNDGTVFEIVKSTGALQTLATFTGDNGANPEGGLIADSAGNLYGTTTGGAYTSGTVFEIVKSTGALQTLATFNGDNGASPQGSLIADSAGNLYGTTNNGGASGDGTVFEIVKSTGALQTLATFTGGNGSDPSAGLIADSAGNLYGTTQYGGRSEPSTVFEIVKSTGALQTLTTLTGSSNASLIADSAGNLYGTSVGGGNSGDGFVFEFVKSTGALQTLATFTGANGSRPYAGLTADGAGNLYGTTHLGGASQDGTVFEIVKSTGALQTLANFTGDNGFGPSSGLIFDGAGDLYGTTQQGGASNDGTVFELSPQVTTTSEAPVTPFSGVTIGDVNGGGATDTLTITVGGSGGTLTGTGLSGGTNGVYTLTGTAAAITANLDALSFTPTAGQPNTRSTSTFALSDTSTAFATPATDNRTTVVDTDPAVTNLAQVGTTMIGGVLEVTGTGAAAGDLVTVYATPTSGGSAKVVATATVKSDGTRGFDAKSAAGALAGGIYDVTATDEAAGTTTQSAMSAAIVVTVNPTAQTFYADGDIASKTFSNVTGEPYTGFTNTYGDGTGKLTNQTFTGVSANNVATAITFNPDGTVANESYLDGETESFTYAAGKPQTITYGHVPGEPYTGFTDTFANGVLTSQTFVGASGLNVAQAITFNPDGSVASESFGGITGEPYTSLTDTFTNGVLATQTTFNPDGTRATETFFGITGEPYTGFTDTFTNGLVSSQTFVGTSGFNAATAITFNPDGTVASESFGGITGEPYTGFTDTFTNGMVSGQTFVGTSGFAAATAITFNPNGTVASESFGGITGQPYTGFTDTFTSGMVSGQTFVGTSGTTAAQAITFNANGTVASETFGGITGEPYTGLTDTFTGGTLTAQTFVGTSGSSAAQAITFNLDGTVATETFGGITGQAYTGATVTYGANETILAIDYSGISNSFAVNASEAPRVRFLAADSYAGGTTLIGTTLELGAVGAAGSGSITFKGAATLELDAGALTGSNGQYDFANPIAGATTTSQVIDLRSLAYVQGSTAASLAADNTTVSVGNGTSAVTLHLASAQAGSTFKTQSDGSGGTLVFDPPATPKIDTSWLAAAMAPFGSGGVLGDAHAGAAAHDPYGVTALGASADQAHDHAHAASVFGHGASRAI